MTNKQAKVMKDLSENIGKPKGRAMRDAGYAISTSKTPKLLTNSKAWEQTMEKALPDKKLLQRHNELLDKQEYIAIGKVGEREVVSTGEIDAIAVAKGLDMAYKLKSKYPPQDINFRGKIEQITIAREPRK